MLLNEPPLTPDNLALYLRDGCGYRAGAD